jgi:hypothetical protein
VFDDAALEIVAATYDDPGVVTIGLDPAKAGRVEPVIDVPGGDIAFRDFCADVALISNPWVNGRYALAAVVWGLILLVVFGLGAGPTHANDLDMLAFYDAPAVQKVSAPVVKAKPRRAKPKPRKSYGFRSAPKSPVTSISTEAVTRCLAPVRVVGSQWATDSGAEDSAQKAWSEQVRFSHGESFMDLEHAQSYRKRCSRSSIGEALGQTLHRCEIEALPCRPGMVEGAKP